MDIALETVETVLDIVGLETVVLEIALETVDAGGIAPGVEEIVLHAAVEETGDYWAFLKATQDDRQIEPDSVVGIILSALMSKL